MFVDPSQPRWSRYQCEGGEGRKKRGLASEYWFLQTGNRGNSSRCRRGEGGRREVGLMRSVGRKKVTWPARFLAPPPSCYRHHTPSPPSTHLSSCRSHFIPLMQQLAALTVHPLSYSFIAPSPQPTSTTMVLLPFHLPPSKTLPFQHPISARYTPLFERLLLLQL